MFAGRLCLVFPPRPCHAGPWEGLKAAPSLTWLPFSPQTPFRGRVPPAHLIMSRRSQRLTRYSSQGDDDGGSSSSGGSSVMGSQSTLFKDSPLR